MTVARISVAGCSGSGKTTFARALAARLGVPHIELDGLFHLPGWQERPREDFRELVRQRLDATDGWVIDGNYSSKVKDLVWARAEVVVAFDLPRRTVMRRVIGRTLRRAVTREELWNGNREPALGVLRWDPQQSIVRWTWTEHARYHEQLVAAAADPDLAHLRFEWIRTAGDDQRVLERLG